jgi:hypothetical protein
MILRALRILIGGLICLIAILLPYRLRIFYFSLVASLVHAPFILFGKLAKMILASTNTPNPYSKKYGE